MSTRYVNPELVPERVGWRYQGTLKDEAGAVIPAATFTALTVTIYALDAAQTIIQASTSILNVGRGVLDAFGVLTVTFVPTDSAIVDPTSMVSLTPRETVPGERHIALVEGDYAGTRKFAREIEWPVRNLSKRS
jgi:hypothetical protein